jgi:Transposase DDE domain group 1
MHELAHEFTDRKVSPWGGLKYFHKIYVTSGIRDYLSKLDIPHPGSNRGYQAIDIIEGFLASVILGARRLEHSSMIRMDNVVQEIFGWKKGMASASTFSRFFSKYTVERNDKIFPKLMKYILSLVPMKYITIDIDSTIITRYGHQEYACKGYNPNKNGRVSHHPIMAFCDELKMVVNAWMRSGDSNSAKDSIEFLKEVFTIMDRSNIGLIRGDSGFYSQHIMGYLEEKPNVVPYIFRAKMTTALASEIMEIKRFYHDESIMPKAAYAEIEYQAANWKQNRRMIIVRTPKKYQSNKPKELFEEYENLSKYDYTAYVTNSNLSMVEVHRRYNQRGDSENRIKELKYDFGMDGFALQEFGAMEAAFRFVMVAYNIMTLFKQAIMNSERNHRLPTIRFQCIAIGSYLTKRSRKLVMKLSAEGRRRHFLEHLFEKLEVIRPPYKFSNA